jgi:hypothetical protein
MLERLKSLFRSREPEIEYERQGEPESTVLPAGPITGTTPAMTVEDPAGDAKTDDDARL